ncbi:MAG: hypothetical protein QXT72_03400 [Candidatus Micrarchaeia archaeon]
MSIRNYKEVALIRVNKLIFSSFLLFEPLFEPIYTKETKVFKYIQNNSSIKVERMGDKLATAQKQKEEQEKIRQIEWPINSYKKLDTTFKIIKELESKLDDKKIKEIEKKLKSAGYEDRIFSIENYKKGLGEMHVPENYANMKRDGSITPFMEAKMFLLVAYITENEEMANAILDAIKNRKEIDIGYYMGGYGRGTKYILNLNPEDSQIAILYRVLKRLKEDIVLKRLKEEGVDVSQIDWNGVSYDTSKGNPFQRLDEIYSAGKYPQNYEDEMYNLLKKYISPKKTDKPLRNVDMDPEKGNVIPDPTLRQMYGETKDEINNLLIKLISKYPEVANFIPDIYSDITSILVKEGFNKYIGDPRSNENEELFKKKMNEAVNYMKALELCFKSIEQNLPKIIEAIQKKDFLKLYPPNKFPLVAKLISDSIQNKDINLEKMSKKDMKSFMIKIYQAFFYGTLPNYTGYPELFTIHNPWFKAIYFDGKERISATLTQRDIQNAEKILENKWKSFILVPKDIVTTKEERDPTFDSVSGTIYNDMDAEVYVFDVEKRQYTKYVNGSFPLILQPINTTALRKTVGIGENWPRGDRFNIDLGWFEKKYLLNNGWKFSNSYIDKTSKEKIELYQRKDETLEVISKNEKIISFNYYPCPLKVLGLFEFTRAKLITVQKTEDGFKIRWEIIPPYGRYSGAKLLTENNFAFNRDKKDSRLSFVEREYLPKPPIIPSATSRMSVQGLSFDPNSFYSVAKDLGINIDYLNNLYYSSIDLEKALSSGREEDINNAAWKLIQSARDFTSVIWDSKLANDSSLSNSDKEFLQSFKDGKVNDLNRWIDIMKGRNYGGAADLSRIFLAKSQATTDITTSMKINTFSIALEKPINMIPLKDASILSFSGITYGRATTKLDGMLTTTIQEINPDGTYSDPIVTQQKIHFEESDGLWGGTFDFGRTKKGKYGSLNLLFGNGFRHFDFIGAGDNIVDSILTKKNLLQIIASIPQATKLSYTQYNLFGTNYYSTRIEAKYISLSPLSDLLYLLTGKKVSPVLDIGLGDIFEYDKKEGMKLNKEKFSYVESTFNLGKASTYIRKELGGTKATEIYASWKKPFNVDFLDEVGMYGRWNALEGSNYGFSVKIGLK